MSGELHNANEQRAGIDIEAVRTSGEQHVPEDMTALVRRFNALGFAGHRADQLAVEVRDSLWLAQHDDRVRALPDRETIARALFDVRDDEFDLDEWDDLDSVQRERWYCYADAVIALFGQETS